MNEKEAACTIQRLEAEVERLTPREPSAIEITATLNKHRFMSRRDWTDRLDCEAGEPFFTSRAARLRLCLRDARYIAQGYLRDAKGGG